MSKHKTTATLFIFCFILLCSQLSINGDEQQQQFNQNKPSFTEKVTNTISMLKKSHKRSWDNIRALVNQMQIQLFPPNLDFRVTESGGVGGDGTGGKVKAAAKKSFGASKVTVEESAKSAGKVAGVAVHKTAEKLKEGVSNKDESDADL